MTFRSVVLASGLAWAACLSAFSPVLAGDVCQGFKWDVSQERRLFARSAVREVASNQATSAPLVRPDRLYQLELTRQEHVVLTTAPGKTAAVGPAFAGIVTLNAPAPGSYRISIDGPYWIDMLSHGALIAPKDYASAPGCAGPRKIVIFELPARGSYVLQLSDADQRSARVAITAVAPRTL